MATENNSVLPLYAKFSLITIGTLSFFYILYIGKGIAVPLIFAIIFAILLNPFVNFLCQKGLNRVCAIFIALFSGLFLVFLLMYFIGSQLAAFFDSLPQLKQKLTLLYHEILHWMAGSLNMEEAKLYALTDSKKVESVLSDSTFIGQTLGTISGMLVVVFVIPVYIFLILFYKPLLLEFIARLFKPYNLGTVAEVLNEGKSLIQSYLVGLLLETLLVASLNSVALLIIGIEYAVLIGVIGSLLNIIPYIGGLIALSIPILVAIGTKTPIDALWVFIAYTIIQFMDNNYFVPKIVASKLKINALVSIIAVLIGGALWGVAGMFLSIPIIAILKVVCDKITPLAPLGFLIGDNQPDMRKVIFRFNFPGRKKPKMVASQQA